MMFGERADLQAASVFGKVCLALGNSTRRARGPAGRCGLGRQVNAARFAKRLRGSVAAALVLAFGAESTWAQQAPDTLADLTLEELTEIQLVSASSKRLQNPREAPSVVSVVTAVEIRQHGYRTLGDILRTLPGFSVTSDRNYTYLGVRGLGLPGDYNTRILLLVDGVRTNDNVYSEAFVAHEFVIDPDLIERVEVSRGPGASVYGDNAFFAVVNVVTRRGGEFDGGRISAAGASFGTWSGQVTYGRKTAGGLEFLASGTVLDSSGQTLTFPEFSATNGGVVAGADTEHVARAFASVGYEGFTFQAAHNERRKGIPTASYGTIFGDPRSRTRDELTLLSARYERALGLRLDFSSRVSFGAYDYHGVYPYEVEPSRSAINTDGASGRWWGAEASGTFRAGDHTLLFGGEYQGSLRQRQHSEYVDYPLPGFVVDNRDQRFGLYAQDDIRVGPRVRLSLGARFDHYDDVGGQANPRLGLIVAANKATTLKLLYGSAFRTPNEYEQHYYPLTHPDLEAETIKTLEAVVERSLGAHTRVVGSVFGNRIRQLIVLHSTEAEDLFFQNHDDVDALGAELALEAQFRGRATGRMSYSFQRARTDGAQSLPNSPRHMLKANVAVPIAGDRLWAGADAQYVSSRQTPAGTTTPGFAVANLTLSARRLSRALEASASVYNLFDTRYSDPASEEHLQATILQDGRSFRLRLAWSF